jgi:hypothetical protein
MSASLYLQPNGAPRPTLWARLCHLNPHADARFGLEQRYRWPVWVAILSLFVVVHYTLFGFVHNYVDLRVCIGYSPDPLLKVIPFDMRWIIVSRDFYLWITLIVSAVFIVQSFRGTHSGALRFALALCFMTSMRMACLISIPLCRPTVQALAPPPLASPQMLNLHFFSVPWRVFALNDLVYSGHTALFLLMLLSSRTWAPLVRIGIGVFLAFMIYSLLATRDHYSIDILLAFPAAFFANFLAVSILRGLKRFTSSSTTGTPPFNEEVEMPFPELVGR